MQQENSSFGSPPLPTSTSTRFNESGSPKSVGGGGNSILVRQQSQEVATFEPVNLTTGNLQLPNRSPPRTRARDVPCSSMMQQQQQQQPTTPSSTTKKTTGRNPTHFVHQNVEVEEPTPPPLSGSMPGANVSQHLKLEQSCEEPSTAATIPGSFRTENGNSASTEDGRKEPPSPAAVDPSTMQLSSSVAPEGSLFNIVPTSSNNSLKPPRGTTLESQHHGGSGTNSANLSSGNSGTSSRNGSVGRLGSQGRGGKRISPPMGGRLRRIQQAAGAARLQLNPSVIAPPQPNNPFSLVGSTSNTPLLPHHHSASTPFGGGGGGGTTPRHLQGIPTARATLQQMREQFNDGIIKPYCSNLESIEVHAFDAALAKNDDIEQLRAIASALFRVARPCMDTTREEELECELEANRVAFSNYEVFAERMLPPAIQERQTSRAHFAAVPSSTSRISPHQRRVGSSCSGMAAFDGLGGEKEHTAVPLDQSASGDTFAMMSSSFATGGGMTRQASTGNFSIMSMYRPVGANGKRASHFVETQELVKTEDDAGTKYVNQYIILDELGRGTQGKVKMAYDPVEKENRAIKIIRRPAQFVAGAAKNMLEAQRKKERLRREIAVMKKVHHKNIVRLYEVIDDPHANKLYLVMQYVEHGPLVKMDELQLTCPRMDQRKFAAIARQLCAGLAYLHFRGIVHRDIKPDNILRGKDEQVFLADFGVSEVFEYDEEDGTVHSPDTTLTSIEQIRKKMRLKGGTNGTPAFLAPELLRVPNRPTSARTTTSSMPNRSENPTEESFLGSTSRSPNRGGGGGGGGSSSARKDPTTPASGGLTAANARSFGGTAESMMGTNASSSTIVSEGGVDACGVDIWALGVTFFLLLTGRMPFANDFEQLCRGTKKLTADGHTVDVEVSPKKEQHGHQADGGPDVVQNDTFSSRMRNLSYCITSAPLVFPDDPSWAGDADVNLHPEWETLLRDMLRRDPRHRPDIREVRRRVKSIRLLWDTLPMTSANAAVAAAVTSHRGSIQASASVSIMPSPLKSGGGGKLAEEVFITKEPPQSLQPVSEPSPNNGATIPSPFATVKQQQDTTTTTTAGQRTALGASAKSNNSGSAANDSLRGAPPSELGHTFGPGSAPHFNDDEQSEDAASSHSGAASHQQQEPSQPFEPPVESATFSGITSCEITPTSSTAFLNTSTNAGGGEESVGMLIRTNTRHGSIIVRRNASQQNLSEMAASAGEDPLQNLTEQDLDDAISNVCAPPEDTVRLQSHFSAIFEGVSSPTSPKREYQFPNVQNNTFCSGSFETKDTFSETTTSVGGGRGNGDGETHSGSTSTQGSVGRGRGSPVPLPRAPPGKRSPRANLLEAARLSSLQGNATNNGTTVVQATSGDNLQSLDGSANGNNPPLPPRQRTDSINTLPPSVGNRQRTGSGISIQSSNSNSFFTPDARKNTMMFGASGFDSRQQSGMMLGGSGSTNQSSSFSPGLDPQHATPFQQKSLSPPHSTSGNEPLGGSVSTATSEPIPMEGGSLSGSTQ